MDKPQNQGLQVPLQDTKAWNLCQLKGPKSQIQLIYISLAMENLNTYIDTSGEAWSRPIAVILKGPLSRKKYIIKRLTYSHQK